ncbi:hypothetical protein [Leptothermofonsia sp. ETS-13]|uniref:hypothetical protein n=1 Tax=Leptothermofonsia sp. ETS-13 TaxID=3035696 RepID=UPI003BA2B4FF
MTQRQFRRKYRVDSHVEHSSLKSGHERSRTLREHLKHERTSPYAEKSYHSRHPSLTALIEQDAPLQSHSGLVLMYVPFQAELHPQEGQGVASWIQECVRKHGIPSLVRFDYHRRAQVFRRDQFQPWLEPLLSKIPS